MVPQRVSSLYLPLEGFLRKIGDDEAVEAEDEDSGCKSDYGAKAEQVYGNM